MASADIEGAFEEGDGDDKVQTMKRECQHLREKYGTDRHTCDGVETEFKRNGLILLILQKLEDLSKNLEDQRKDNSQMKKDIKDLREQMRKLQLKETDDKIDINQKLSAIDDRLKGVESRIEGKCERLSGENFNLHTMLNSLLIETGRMDEEDGS